MSDRTSVLEYMGFKKIQRQIDLMEDVFDLCVGKMGRWQVWMIFWIYLCKFTVAWHQLIFMIIDPYVEFWCEDRSFKKCDPNCPRHEFDRLRYTETLTTQFDLVCTKSHSRMLLQVITMLGVASGNFLWGCCGDIYGRRKLFIIATVLQLLSGIAVGWVPYFWSVLLLKYLVSLATGGMMIISFVLLFELIGGAHRTEVGILYQIPFCLGHLSLTLISFFFYDWRVMATVIACFTTVLLPYICFIPESPRWLITKQRFDEAVAILEDAALFNHLPTLGIKETIVQYVNKVYKKHDFPKSKPKEIFTNFFLLRIWILITMSWITVGMCFFGAANIIKTQKIDHMKSICFTALATIAGCLFSIYTLSYWGRKGTLIFSNLLSGLSLFTLAITIPYKFLTLILILLSVIFFGMMVQFCCIYIYTAELFPTDHRTAALGFASTTARFGAILALITMEYFSHRVSVVLLGSSTILSVLLAIFLPETQNRKLTNTIEETKKAVKSKVPIKQERKRSKTFANNYDEFHKQWMTQSETDIYTLTEQKLNESDVSIKKTDDVDELNSVVTESVERHQKEKIKKSTRRKTIDSEASTSTRKSFKNIKAALESENPEKYKATRRSTTNELKSGKKEELKGKQKSEEFQNKRKSESLKVNSMVKWKPKHPTHHATTNKKEKIRFTSYDLSTHPKQNFTSERRKLKEKDLIK